MQNQPGARAHITPAGLMFLAITSVGWGFNWPVTKYLLSELPPLTLRGGSGVVGAALLAALAIMRGQSLQVSRGALAAPDAGGGAQRDGLDGADGPRVALASGQRSGVDRLHHAGMGLDAGLAGTRRAADHGCARWRW